MLEPPVPPVLAFPERPNINLSVKSGVLLVPSHKFQPDGISAFVPDHIAIKPVGIETMPVNADPSPENDVAVSVPVTVALLPLTD